MKIIEEELDSIKLYVGDIIIQHSSGWVGVLVEKFQDFPSNYIQSYFMEDVSLNLALDEAEDLNIVENELPFISKGSNDILGILSRILQVGDAVWFTFERKSFKPHLFHLTINEGEKGSIYGETVTIEVTRDLMFYIKTYGGKLSAISGLLLPIGSIVLSSLPI